MTNSEENSDVIGQYIEDLANNNPKIRLITDYLQRLNTNNEYLTDLEDKIKYLEEKNSRLLRSYKVLSKRNQIISSLLGMCPRCWGSDAQCDCRGTGGPGSGDIDKNLFKELIIPILQKNDLSNVDPSISR